jgi:hypothetical protein
MPPRRPPDKKAAAPGNQGATGKSTGRTTTRTLPSGTDRGRARAAACRSVATDLQPKIRTLADQLAGLANVVESLSLSSLCDVSELVKHDLERLDDILCRPHEDGSIPPWWSV